jgi:exopolysaccharide biosynthesis polyprenyl glycosylphosphotransferase
MLSQRSVGIYSVGLFCQLLMVTASFWAWLFIWQGELFAQPSLLQRYLLYNEFLLVGILFGASRRSENNVRQHDWVLANRRSFRQCLLGLFCVFLVVFALQDTAVSRSFFFSYIPWFYLTLLFCIYFLPRTLGKWVFSGVHEERVALVGTVEQGAKLESWLERKSLIGLRTIGLISLESVKSEDSPFPLLGTISEIGQILTKHSISQLIVLDLAIGNERLREMTRICEEAAVRLLAVNNLYDYFNHTTTTFDDDGICFIGLRKEPLESPLNRFLKRLLDICVAVPVILFILPPVTLLVWLLQRWQSPGPIFFAQVRTGMRGRAFTIYKYRTMHLNGETEAKQATKGDPRVYSAGQWLRKLSLDELPQFINVLKGDMSVVGPRPHLPKHEEIFVQVMRRYLIRKFIRPGITGWAQVNGYRGEIHKESDIQQRVEADIHYLENWAFSLDCLIILKTIKHCLFPPQSAY